MRKGCFREDQSHIWNIHKREKKRKEKKRKEKERCVSLRKFAEQVGISPVYLSNLENDRMPAPKDDVVSNIAIRVEKFFSNSK